MAWTSGWLDSIVKTSEGLLGELREGVSEFVTTVATDSVNQRSEVESTLAELMEEGKQILPEALPHRLQEVATTSTQQATHLLQSVLSLLRDGEEMNSEGMNSPASSKMLFKDRKQAALEQLRKDPATYCTAVSPSQEYDHFVETFKLSDKTDEIAQLLAEYDDLRALHTRLVPVAVDENLFWTRYFYRILLVTQAEERRKALMSDVAVLQAEQEEDIAWEEDEDDDAAPKSPTAAAAAPLPPPSSSAEASAVQPSSLLSSLSSSPNTSGASSPASPALPEPELPAGASFVPLTEAALASPVTSPVTATVQQQQQPTAPLSAISSRSSSSSATEGSYEIVKIADLHLGSGSGSSSRATGKAATSTLKHKLATAKEEDDDVDGWGSDWE